MRVLFVNMFEKRGGAAIVADRISKVLTERFGVECHGAFAYTAGQSAGTTQLRSKSGELVEKIIDRLSNKAGLQYQFFPFSSGKLLSTIERVKPDVISLHNTHGGYFATPLLAKISQHAPVVWTLHDMWSFTGNSAHTFGDVSWQQLKQARHLNSIYPAIGINTGAFLLRQKARVYGRSNLTVVTPSQWLHSLAVKSPVFRGKEIVHINNGVDLKVFRPYDKAEVRASLDIPADARVLMFSADYLKNNPWKGGNDLVEALKLISQGWQGQVHLVIAGHAEGGWLSELPNFVVHYTGYISEEASMARYLSASDLFLYPTRADNLPNVLVEAIACGVPCVTFDVGGCGEIVLNRVNGVVVGPAQTRAMAESVIALLGDDEKRTSFAREARMHAEREFSAEVMGRQYFDLFASRAELKTKTN